MTNSSGTAALLITLKHPLEGTDNPGYKTEDSGCVCVPYTTRFEKIAPNSLAASYWVHYVAILAVPSTYALQGKYRGLPYKRILGKNYANDVWTTTATIAHALQALPQIGRANTLT
jgi:hypothetical protein